MEGPSPSADRPKRARLVLPRLLLAATIAIGFAAWSLHADNGPFMSVILAVVVANCIDDRLATELDWRDPHHAPEPVGWGWIFGFGVGLPAVLGLFAVAGEGRADFAAEIVPFLVGLGAFLGGVHYSDRWRAIRRRRKLGMPEFGAVEEPATSDVPPDLPGPGA